MRHVRKRLGMVLRMDRDRSSDAKLVEHEKLAGAFERFATSESGSELRALQTLRDGRRLESRRKRQIGMSALRISGS